MLITFRSYHAPYFQPKRKCVLNDSEWLETHFKLNMFLKSVMKTDLDLR